MARKASVDKTPIEMALETPVEASAEEKKAPAKRAAKADGEKKAPAKKAAKKDVKAEITVQYAGKSYSNEELMKIAKDVWRFDLKKKVTDLVSVELYVKPEENLVYYVFNGTESGNFNI